VGCASSTSETAAPAKDSGVSSEVSVDAPVETAVEAGTDADTTEVADETSAMATAFGEPCGELATIAFVPGLQFSGSVSWTRTTTKGMERVSVSAPIHPSVVKLYEADGATYPKTHDLQVSLAKASALTYCFLLDDCSKSDSSIKTKPPLTADEIQHDYDAVASCAYDKYTAKPYWIPQLVLDVDICTTMLGTGWRTPTEDDVNAFVTSDYEFMESTLGSTSGNTYFTLDIWVRATDGTIQIGHLQSTASKHLEPLGISGDALKTHYEGSVGLRCIKRKPL
jgi:hypothetical protein